MKQNVPETEVHKGFFAPRQPQNLSERMKVGVSDFKLFTLFVFADAAFRLLFSCCFLLSWLNSYPLKLLLFVFFCCKNVPRSRLKGISVQLW